MSLDIATEPGCTKVHSMRKYSEQHFNEVISSPGNYENALFADCIFTNVSGIVLKDCVLRGSSCAITKAENIKGLTITLDCFSFDKVELSEYVFDLYLALLLKTKGNAEKRKKIIDLIGHDRVFAILKDLETLER